MSEKIKIRRTGHWEQDVIKWDILHKNELHFWLNIYGGDYSRESVLKFFNKFCFFKPKGFDIYTNNGDDSHFRYSEESFADTVLHTKENSIRLRNLRKAYEINYSDFQSDTIMDFNMPLDIWEDQKYDFIANVDEIFVELGGCFAYITNAFDESEVHSKHLDSRKYLSDRDYDGILNIPTYIDSSGIFVHEYVDTKFLPAHQFTYRRMQFKPVNYMWIGPDFYRFFSKETLKNFGNCVENVEIFPGFSRICLWEDLYDYNNPIYRERQWDFRNTMKFDDIFKELKSKRCVPQDPKSNPLIEFKTGKFPHGGDLFVIAYHDDKYEPCCKLEATTCDEYEVKGSKIVWYERKKLK